jgi:hypothetical protein
MSGQGEVNQIESWQLPRYLQQRKAAGTQEITWNREKLSLDEALQRATGLSPTATVVTDGDTVYVAEPDHSADEAPPSGPVPLQIWPRRG